MPKGTQLLVDSCQTRRRYVAVLRRKLASNGVITTRTFLAGWY